jgi:hypothetical protein
MNFDRLRDEVPDRLLDFWGSPEDLNLFVLIPQDLTIVRGQLASR